jgi:hypothetical protein
MHESLELNIEILILVLQHLAMRIQSINLTLNIVISIKDVAIVEAHAILFFFGTEKLVINSAHPIFSFKNLSSEISATSILSFGLSSKIRLMAKLTV